MKSRQRIHHFQVFASIVGKYYAQTKYLPVKPNTKREKAPIAMRWELLVFLQRVRDSNPRNPVRVYSLSRRARSTTPATLSVET